MDYGRAVRVARSARNLSQKELAERLEVHPSLISHIEAGKRRPSTKTLEDIATTLQVPMYLLLLLGSEESDIRAIPAPDAAAIGQTLLKILVDVT